MTHNILSWILNHHSMNHKGGVISSKVYMQCLAQGMRNACTGCNTWVWPVHEKATSSQSFILFSSKRSMERMSCMWAVLKAHRLLRCFTRSFKEILELLCRRVLDKISTFWSWWSECVDVRLEAWVGANNACSVTPGVTHKAKMPKTCVCARVCARRVLRQ